MAALDFPNSPTLNQQFAAPNGVTYKWDGTAWIVLGGAGLWTDTGTALTPTDATRNVTIPGTATTAKGRLQSDNSTATPWLALSVNRDMKAGTQDDATKKSWYLLLDTVNDACSIGRQPAGGAANNMLYVDASGNVSPSGYLSAGSHVRVTGSASGLKCQNTGTIGGDGYSNAVAFGWNGSSVTVRVDSTALGTMNITPPSDERLKTAVAEDVPGIDALLALRPVTFAYAEPGTVDDPGHPPGRHYGLIAQEAQPHVPLAVEDDGSAEHWLSLDYRTLVPVLIRAIQELAARVTAAPAPSNA